jgi:hypothetical protein
MGWEKRGHRERYCYTRSRREGGRVIRQYIGVGIIAEIAAQEDQEERQRRLEDREQRRREREEATSTLEALTAFAAATDAEAHRQLSAAGYRCHRGEWRRRRTP